MFLLGANVRVVYSPNPSQIGLEGVVTYETRGYIILKTSKGRELLIEDGIIKVNQHVLNLKYRNNRYIKHLNAMITLL